MTDTSKTSPGVSKTALIDVRQRAARAGKAVEANPLAIVAGGIALGAVAGALLPRTRKETELLGPVGKRVKDVAAGAADAAKAAATAELASLPLTRDTAREQLGKLVTQVSQALSSAGEAAIAHAEQSKTAQTATVKPAKRSPKKAK